MHHHLTPPLQILVLNVHINNDPMTPKQNFPSSKRWFQLLDDATTVWWKRCHFCYSGVQKACNKPFFIYVSDFFQGSSTIHKIKWQQNSEDKWFLCIFCPPACQQPTVAFHPFADHSLCQCKVACIWLIPLLPEVNELLLRKVD